MANSDGSKREATFAATRRLREEYPERFREIQAEEFKKRGIPVPPTREEKARLQAEKLMAAYPHVVRSVVDEQEEPEQAEVEASG